MFEPRRSLVVPTLVALAPVAFLAYRGATARAGASWRLAPTTAALLVAAAVPAGYALAAVAVSLLAPSPAGPLSRAVFAPTDGALALLAAALLVAVGYLGAAAADAVPPAASTVAGAAGLVAALPLALLYLATTAAGNAAGITPPFPVRALVVAVGVALSVVWLALLANAGAALA